MNLHLEAWILIAYLISIVTLFLLTSTLIGDNLINQMTQLRKWENESLAFRQIGRRVILRYKRSLTFP